MFEKIYRIVRQIPPGKVATYGQIAKMAGVHPRTVGVAMNKNPHPVIMPCHRVVGWNGHLVGYAHGLPKKRKLLLEEGVRFKNPMFVDLEKNLWRGFIF